MENLLFFLALGAMELIYFRIAKAFNIVDRPNHRSSHNRITIRGGGIIFFIAGLLAPLVSGDLNIFYLAGLLFIGTISFVDDLKNLPGKIRFAVQAVSIGLIIYSLSPDVHPAMLILIGIGMLGALNIYNFMDGINGITGLYSLVILTSLLYVDFYQTDFISSDYIWLPIIAVSVFLFFNLRKKAVCFAGDVGSVSIAFIILFLTGKLIVTSGDSRYVLFLLVYGLDGVSTIFFRLMRGEKLVEAHRSHFYQYLANERKWPHVTVAFLFAAIQLIVNAAVIHLKVPVLLLWSFIPVTFAAIVGIRLYLQGSRQLLRRI